MLNIVSPSTGRTADVIWFGSRPVADHGASTPRYTFTDHLGTPILQTAPSATVTWRAEYEPFGNVYALRQGGVADDQPLRFPGQQVFSSTSGGEESYNIFRWYRSGWGRYTQADPLSPMAAASEPYRYVRSNPILKADPLGLFEYRKNFDLVKLQKDECGSTGLKFDIVWECYDSSGCEKLKFTVPVIFTIRYDDDETYKHELVHVQLFEQYLHAGAVKTLTPAENKTYANFFQCRDAALKAKHAFWKAVDPFNFKEKLKHWWHDVTDPGCHP